MGRKGISKNKFWVLYEVFGDGGDGQVFFFFLVVQGLVRGFGVYVCFLRVWAFGGYYVFRGRILGRFARLGEFDQKEREREGRLDRGIVEVKVWRSQRYGMWGYRWFSWFSGGFFVGLQVRFGGGKGGWFYGVGYLELVFENKSEIGLLL